MEKITKKDIILLGLGAIAWPVLYFIFTSIGGSATLLNKFIRTSVYTTASNINAHSSNTITFIIFLILVYLFISGIKSVVPELDKLGNEFDKYKEEYRSIENKSEEEKHKYDELKSEYFNQKTNHRILIWSLMIILLIFSGIAAVNTKANSLYDQFIKESETISPYISDQEMKILKSKWRLMKKDEDHEEIIKKIDSIYVTNNFPKPERDNWGLKK
jgi:uncharacterized membrane protein